MANAPNQRRAAKRSHAEQVSRTILHCANDLFAEHGVECVSMHQIAKRAGVGQGTLYRRYASKSDLCMELMKERFDAFVAESERQLESMRGRPVRERLFRYFECLIDFIDVQCEWLHVMHANAPAESRAHKGDIFSSPPYVHISGTIAKLLEEARREGKARTVEPQSAAHMLLAALAPPVYLHLKHGLGLSAPQIAAHYRDSILRPVVDSE